MIGGAVEHDVRAGKSTRGVGEVRPGRIKDSQVEQTGTTLSVHLARMVNAGLVTQRRAGRSIIYAADLDRMNGLLVFMQSRHQLS